MPIVKNPLEEVREQIRIQTNGLTPSSKMLHEIIISSISKVFSTYMDLNMPNSDYVWDTCITGKIRNGISIHNIMRYVLGEILCEYGDDSEDTTECWNKLTKRIAATEKTEFLQEDLQ